MSSDVIVNTQETGGTSAFRWIGFGLLFTVSLFLFTLLKVPQPKIQAWLLGTLNQQLIPIGFQVSAEKGGIAMGWGLYYEMEGVRLTKASSQRTLKFARLEVSPSLLGPVLQGKLGGSFRLEESGGSISGAFSVKGEEIETHLDFEDVNLGRWGFLPFLADIEGTADIRGSVDLAGSTTQISSMTGKIDLALAKLVVDSQKVAGFEVPRTAMGEGVVKLTLDAGKAQVVELRLGKGGANGDDVSGSVTGEIKLNRTIDNSDANLRVKFGFSDSYRREKTISLLDSLLGMFKLTDGSFSMKLTGPLYSLQPLPDR